MLRSFLLVLIILCCNYSYSQTAAVDHVCGRISFSPKIFEENKIKKEIIYSIDTANGITDSTIYKIIQYDLSGKKIEEIRPREYEKDTIHTFFYYNAKQQWIKDVIDNDTTNESENKYDIYGNRIKRYTKMNNQLMATHIDVFNDKQELIKSINIFNLDTIDTLSTINYYYDKDGKIDSIVQTAQNDNYTQLCTHSKNDDTTFLRKKIQSEISICFYNNLHQLIKEITTQNLSATTFKQTTQSLSTITFEQIDLCSYNRNGTLNTEETIHKTSRDGKLIATDQMIYHHYYFQ